MTSSEPGIPENLERLVTRGDFTVPPYPAAALRLKRLIDSGSFGLAEVADAAAADPALAAALLRLANSSLYRGNGPVITSLSRAVNRLGARPVAALAVAAGLSASACADGPLVDVKYHVWRRSLTCALASQALAGARGVDREEAFVAGVLYGFGRSVALGCLERLLAEPRARAESRTLMQWLEAIESHRPALARRVAQAWQLPEEIASALGAEPAPGKESPIGDLVLLADRIAVSIDRGQSLDEVVHAPGLQAADQRMLAEFLTGLPAALEALLEAPHPTKPPRANNAVSKPTTSLRSELRRAAFEVADLRNRRAPETLEGIAVTPEGIVVSSQRPLQEGCVARLALGTADKKVEGWFSIALCVPDRGRFRVEGQTFAATRELRDLLLQLWTAAR
jgi:HD-like signal output (HDOD) protein